MGEIEILEDILFVRVAVLKRYKEEIDGQLVTAIFHKAKVPLVVNIPVGSDKEWAKMHKDLVELYEFSVKKENLGSDFGLRTEASCSNASSQERCLHWLWS